MPPSDIQDLQAALSLQLDEAERVVAPFIDARLTKTDRGWSRLASRLRRKWLKRWLKRRMLGWIPGTARNQAYVNESYSKTFSARPWPDVNAAVGSDSKPTGVEFGDRCWIVRRGGLPRLHLAMIARVIEVLRPRSVLEVGAGTGINLLLLSARFPEIKFSGIELTEVGVAQAKSMQQAADLPARLAEYCPWSDIDRQAFRRVDFQVGDATKLPFADSSFDLVMTRQALEQMESVRAPALREIARVAARHTLMCEPFADVNSDPLRRRYIAAKDYFSLRIDQLPTFGLNPIGRFLAFPQNLVIGIGIAVAEKISRP